MIQLFRRSFFVRSFTVAVCLIMIASSVCHAQRLMQRAPQNNYRPRIVSPIVQQTTQLVSQETEAATPEAALKRLKDGNQRFVTQASVHPDSTMARLKQTATDGQHPFATILACSDSRVPLELLFDQGFGDIFVVRVAGNICSTDEMGSIEYAVEHVKTPLLVILGHTQCGAVTAACAHVHEHNHVQNIVERIEPAVDRAQKASPDLKDEKLVDATVKENVWLAVETLFHESPTVVEAVQEKKLQVVAAVYDIKTGKVDWLGEHPEQVNLLKKHDAEKE